MSPEKAGTDTHWSAHPYVLVHQHEESARDRDRALGKHTHTAIKEVLRN